MPAVTGRRLGFVVGGSLTKGLDVKLDREQPIEELAVGRYVVAHSGRYRFFSMITDVVLDSTNPMFEKTPPDLSNDFLRQVHMGTTAFGRVHLSPMLMLEEGEMEPRPVKTIPSHYTPVYEATADDVAYIFGEEGYDQRRRAYYFYVGEPLDMDNIKITINLQRLVERSSGVFGKSGTGKTFLSRLILAGVIKHGVAVNLVFDMHNEYGWAGTHERGVRAKGLKDLFPGRVAIFTLDPESSRRRGAHPDAVVEIGYNQIEPQDVEMLQGILGLSDVQVGALYSLERRLGRDWISKLLADEVSTELEDILEQKGLHPGTLGAIRRKLGLMVRFGFLKRRPSGNPVRDLMDYLGRGMNVVLEFGRYGNSLEAYILVANYLTRRIHQEYVRRKEAAIGGQGTEPLPLVITVEEAHKFLDPAIARQTIFGTIARELRKYNVTLFIVDQRPSQIDPEVMSQIGTRVTALLDDEADIRAILMGISGAAGLKEVLARLDTQQQALILGHAVPMPVVIHTRSYDVDFYRDMGYREGEELQAALARNVAAMRGPEDFEGLE
ncbi:MAG TPA: ATP-binding protein [Anaerolineae bacterium]|nr:ATP-binding protein [Anaerolineae bacterium]HIQ05452.1 ATP-binding protein [Anaerolineae bacterium]